VVPQLHSCNGRSYVNGHIVCPPSCSLQPPAIARALFKRFVHTLLVAVAAPLGVGGALSGQAVDSTLHCDGRGVLSVGVEAERPAFRGALGWWRKIARSVGLHHQTTSLGLVRRFVTLDPGQACTEFRRSESERILRAQPFIADATVTATPVGDSVRVDVSTVDEVPVVLGARLQGTNIRALNLGTMNFLGAGMHVEGRWEEGRTNRDGFGGKLAHRQILGRPYAIMFEGERRPLGEYFVAGVNHPFYTDLQRVAWHAGYTTSKDFSRLRRPDRSELLQPVDRAMWSAGGVVRIGPPRRLGLIGGAVLGERLVTRHEFFGVDSLTGRSFPTADTAGVRRYPTSDLTSIAAVLGLRALTYSRMGGLDALVAEQDVATGTQIGTMVGVNAWSKESFASVDAYVGGRTRRTLVGARVEGESRFDMERKDSRHLIASGRAAWYFHPLPRWISEVSMEFAGGWRTMLPFQLELGERRTGVRGYARSLEAGGQRLVARVEQRAHLFRYKQTRAAFGAGVFADAGRIWAGDVPFGVTTPFRTSVGAALLAAVPAHSQRTVRAELALPADRGHSARAELRFTVREPIRGFWFEPPRIRWARLSAVPEQIFQWP
jgi:hypothetical protein